MLAVLNAAATDAVIACFEAKYYYWTIRPSQADTTLAVRELGHAPRFSIEDGLRRTLEWYREARQ